MMLGYLHARKSKFLWASASAARISKVHYRDVYPLSIREVGVNSHGLSATSKGFGCFDTGPKTTCAFTMDLIRVESKLANFCGPEKESGEEEEEEEERRGMMEISRRDAIDAVIIQLLVALWRATRVAACGFVALVIKGNRDNYRVLSIPTNPIRHHIRAGG